VSECYINDKKDDQYKEIAPWIQRPYKTSTLFDAIYTSHVFLVNNNKIVNKNYEKWDPEKYNKDTLECLQAKLREINPETIILLPKIMQYIKDSIPKLVNSWNHEVIYDKENQLVKPKLIKKNNEKNPLIVEKSVNPEKKN